LRIRILVAVAALATVAGCAAPGGNTIPGSALPATGSAAAAPATSTPATTSPGTSNAGTSGAGTSAAAPPTQGAPSSTGTPGPARCHTSELSASLAVGEPGAGQRYATLSLTNTSARTCTVFGYGGLQPLDAAKKQLPITLTRDTGRPPKLIRLAPGASVGRTIHWTVVPSGSQPCPTPAYASIIPPDETSPLVIGWSLGPICGTAMDGWPYGVTL
jgi:Domain of unknown function (DUF4232)